MTKDQKKSPVELHQVFFSIVDVLPLDHIIVGLDIVANGIMVLSILPRDKNPFPPFEKFSFIFFHFFFSILLMFLLKIPFVNCEALD